MDAAPLRPARVVGALMMREMATAYGRSPGGFAWAVLEPVAGIALLTLVFGLFLHAPPVGTSFALFYATGLLPFLLYLDLSQKVAEALRFSRPLLIYPRVTLFDAAVARFLLNAVTQLAVFAIVIAGIVALDRPVLALRPEFVALALMLAAALGLAVGLVNCLLYAVAPVWERVWAVLNRPAFLVSCIFYTFESVPQPFRDILWFNPLVHVAGLMRAGFFHGYDAHYAHPAYPLGVAMALAALGLFFLGRYHRTLVHEL